MKTLLLPLCLLSCYFVKAQNLVANASLEDINVCCENNAPCAPEAWFGVQFTTPNAYSAVTFAKKSPFGNACLNLELGYKQAPSLLSVMTPLLCTLRADETYTLSLWIKQSWNKVTQLQAAFSDSVDNGGGLPSAAILIQSNDKYFTDKWTRYSTTYTAKGGEKFMYLGYFEQNESAHFKDYAPGVLQVDSVSLVPENAITDCDIEKRRHEIYEENRRHYLHQICNETYSNLFPHLIDTTAPRIAVSMTPTPTKQPPAIAPGVTSVLQNLEFSLDDATLSTSSYPEVNKLMIYLFKEPSKKVKLTGYTDNQGSDAYNLALSLKRAKAVAAYLTSKGISGARIVTEGKGSANPVASNDTEEGKAQNRRVEFLIFE